MSYVFLKQQIYTVPLDAVAAKGIWLFPGTLVAEHLFVYSSEKISSPALERDSNFTLLLPLSSAMSKGIISNKEQR